MEYLYSDEGQIGWLAGYCHPMRYNEMVAAKKVPQALLDKLPPPSSYKNVVFPTLSQQDAYKGNHHQALGRSGRRERQVKASGKRSTERQLSIN